MSNAPEKNSDAPAEPTGAEATDQTPLSPDEVMQAATDRIAALEAELAEMKERWMRAEAENANVRARAKRDVDETRQYAVQKFASDIVEAAENLKRGMDALPAPAPGQPEILAKVREGLESMERSFISVLERHGIRKEDPVGQTFDPNLHQAMAEQESEAHKPGTVMQAWTAAWTLNGRLLRPAMVVVAKAPAGEIGGPRGTVNTTA
ncbi:MAG: nucleotide exchange factor GrpE [Rhodospirillales bacterium]|nr:nucleotide exchange factor GrpE [Rhodospirillales bacterium]MBN8897607.1 nucleotide exchange factor GrpE [Rhodospirillales bacterium]